MIPLKFNRSASTKTSSKLEWISSFFSFCIVFSIPPFYSFILWYLWHDYTRNVDKISCTCSCWDTAFKGPYETGVASYKHFYFNSTRNMLKIWFLVVTFLMLVHECVKWLITLWLTARLRSLMAILFLSSLFSHYYSWWIYLNYYNDEFYSQWYHQLLFTVTEIISSCAVLWLSTKDHRVSPLLVGTIVGIAFVHVLAACKDQFFENVIQKRGSLHQIVRDIGLMIPDLMHIIIPLITLRGCKRL